MTIGVLMNLIDDYKNQNVTSDEEQQNFSFEKEPDDFSPPPSFASSSDSDLPHYSTKRKSSPLSIILLLFIIIAIPVVVYFGFFHKESKTYFTTELLKQDSTETVETTTPETQKPAENNVITDTNNKPANTVESNQPTTSSEITATDNSLLLAAQQIELLLTNLPPDVRLLTMIMDENSFSVEVTAKTRPFLESYYASIENKFTGSTAFAPSPGTGYGAKALITGVIDVPPPAITMSTQSAQQVMGQIRQLAQQSTLTIIDTKLGSATASKGKSKWPLFIKVRASSQECQQFIYTLAQQNPNLKISKIIIMFTGEDTANLVLRLELFTS